jgi:hypothetical protein
VSVTIRSQSGYAIPAVNCASSSGYFPDEKDIEELMKTMMINQGCRVERDDEEMTKTK